MKRVEVKPHAFFTSAPYRGLNSQLHGLANLPPRKEALVLTALETGWVSEPDWTQWEHSKYSHLEIKLKGINLFKVFL
jgi:hypothetical protein